MTNSGILTDDKTVIESENDVKIKSKVKNSVLDIKPRDFINEEEILVEMFNNRYVNIVETFTGVAQIELGTPLDPNLDRDPVGKILNFYEKHPSITETKS